MNEQLTIPAETVAAVNAWLHEHGVFMAGLNNAARNDPSRDAEFYVDAKDVDADDVAALLLALSACEPLRGLVEAADVLSKIADAYDNNALDDEARKTWGKNDELLNTTPHDRIELYSGRGGKQLLTLADCMNARAALAPFAKGGA